VKASDADRDRCALALRDHYAAGRLDQRQLEQRVARATGAQSREELRGLLRDLPRPPRRGGPLSRGTVRAHAVAFTAVNGGLAGVWAATGEGFYWPGVVLAPGAAMLAGHILMRRAAKARRRRP
jgi:hypothetical protein